jgi:hypothetical protein
VVEGLYQDLPTQSVYNTWPGFDRIQVPAREQVLGAGKPGAPCHTSATIRQESR